MFDRVLIANRGAIAVRIARTLRRMGVHSIGVYAESDRDSLHLSAVDEACPLGDGGAPDTYMNEARLFEIIERTGAQGLHPGYGFLSENAGFAERLAERGVVFHRAAAGAHPALRPETRSARDCFERRRTSPAGQRVAPERGGRPARGRAHRLSSDAEKHGGRRRHRHASPGRCGGIGRRVRPYPTRGGHQLRRRRPVPRKTDRRAATCRGAGVRRRSRRRADHRRPGLLAAAAAPESDRGMPGAEPAAGGARGAARASARTPCQRRVPHGGHR